MASLGREPGSDPRRGALACAIAVAVSLGALLAATAQAQSTDPYLTVQDQAETSQLDTDVTPVAKETDLYTLLHGAPYPKTEVTPGSVTSFDTALHAVAFQNATIGLAAGSRCAVEPVQQKGEDDTQFANRANACEGTDQTQVPRIPAIYRYSEPPNQDPSWDRLDLPAPKDPANSSNSGYVGAITWIDADRALLVGGTGAYPRREQADDGNAPTDPQKADVAGKARAWIYTRAADGAPESLRELDLTSLTAPTTLDGADRAGMRGLSAVDCYEDPNPQFDEEPIELCFAGALGQVWEFRDGEFNGKRVDALSDTADLADASLFRYRVRDIAFVGLEPPVAAAVTAGCCAANQNENTPRLLVYDGATRACEPDNPNHCGRIGPARWFARSFYDRAGYVAGTGLLPADANMSRREVNDTPEWPDSIYSLRIPPQTNTTVSFFSVSGILTPGGPATIGEKPSHITNSFNNNLDGSQTTLVVDPELDLARTRFSTARLLDGDSPSSAQAGPFESAVGELRSTDRPGLGTRGLYVATVGKPGADDAVNANVTVAGQGVNPSGPNGVHRPTLDEAAQGWEPVDQKKLDAHIRSQHYLLPSYTANAIEIVGDDEDAWIVGDHGAILRRDAEKHGAAQGALEPKPPHLGAPRQKRLSDRSAYDDSRSKLPSSAGIVPPLGAETVQLDEPEMFSAGSVGAVNQIVMSRDGSEGWAIGTATGGGPSFTHFDGTTWSRCDPLGIPGEVEPDAACEAMAPLRGYRPNGQGAVQRVNLTHMARVPLENDPYPTNDNELEIVAIGEKYEGPEYKGESHWTMVRYSDGRWSFEEPEAVEALDTTPDTVRGENRLQTIDRINSMAFTAPDDGWLIAGYSPVTGGTSQQVTGAGARLYRYDGLRWIDCQVERPICRDAGRIPQMEREVAGLASAGDRVYLYGQRIADGSECLSAASLTCLGRERFVPMILYRDRDGEWTDGSGTDDGGYDPGFSNPATQDVGRVDSVSVVEGPDGFEGWATGEFGGVQNPAGAPRHLVAPQAALMRLDPASGGGWQRFQSPGALEDYMIDYTRPAALGGKSAGSGNGLQVTYPAEASSGGAFIGQAQNELGEADESRIFAFDSARERFELVDTARPQAGGEAAGEARGVGDLTTMAPDGQGGFWAAVDGHMFHYTDQPPKQVFEEVSNPLGIRDARLKALTGSPDGSVWAATDSDRLYRYDRLTGWEETRIGWDPGRVVTRTSQANEIAIGPNGEGLVVGEEGRIADLSPAGVVVDAAAGRSCALGDAIPCGTSRDLHAVDVAPDGSAIAGGDRLTLLWRPAGGEFRVVAQKPLIGSSTQITAVSMPTPERAYLATSAGTVFRGDHRGNGNWDWEAENVNAKGEVSSIGALRDVDVDASGHGYAAGASGILEREVDGHWRKLPARYGSATAVELPETGGPGVLIGAEGGRILAGQGSELHLARPDAFQAQSGPVVGFAYLPGSAVGTIDAWAGIAPRSGKGGGDSRLLRHRSDPADPLLDPTVAAAALSDAPARADGELALAAFGKSDCDNSEEDLCPEFSATTTTNEVVTSRIVDELSSRRERGELDLAVQSGDATDSAGLDGSSLADVDRLGGFSGLGTVNFPPRALAGQLKHRRYSELVTEELEEHGVAAFAAIGSQDLSETYACAGLPNASTDCYLTKRFANAGENYSWREAFAGRTDPWGDGSDTLPIETEGEIAFEVAPGSEDNSLRTEDQSADADGEGIVPEKEAAIGGANTHYALDAVKDGDAIARIVFVDTSLRSLAASDAQQQPHELGGGQQRFLERMICKEGSSSTFGDGCTRGKDQKAIVVSNTPTYSYGPGALTHTALDSATFEATMLRFDVDLVISGALGYNGLYYTLAPGVHEPCPAGAYPEAPPSGNTPDCLAGPTGPAEAVTKNAPAEASDPASLITGQGLAGAYPTLIAAGAGGKFGPDGGEPPDGPAGQWHGYSIARLLPSGDIVVEQRPILDWIGLDAADHALAPRSRLKLSGYGRSPISTGVDGEGGRGVRAFHYEISNAAITHRYDLVLADPERPTLPCRADDPGCVELQANLSSAGGGSASGGSAGAADNHCAPYLCLPSRIGTIDDQSGQVRAGDGRYPETFAVAMLSVDKLVATYPLVFKRSPSFVTSPSVRAGALPKLSGARPGAPPPPPPPPGLPQIPQVDVPQIPPPPGLPQLSAATPPELQPPAPPAPPPPSQQPTPLDLSVAPPGVSISTPTALIQPPTPPVNPAPPGGARREARQRQAAAQKGGADSEAEGSEAQKMGGDVADGPDAQMGTQAATRHDYSFSAYRSSANDPFGGAAALYTGGLGLAAFALAMGWRHGRPTPRRGEPRLPAPARSMARNRWE